MILPLLNKPEIKTINNRIYEHDSYINSINEYINTGISSDQPNLYKIDPLQDQYSQEELLNMKIENIIGRVIKFNEENFTVEVDIGDSFCRQFKDEIDKCCYIQLRLTGDLDENKKIIIEKIICMEINFDPANITPVISVF
jgi:hypothetical protein